MAKKSKGFQELLKQSRSQQSSQKALNKFERQFMQSERSNNFAGIVQNPKGEVKMSEVLEVFAEPLLQEAISYDQQFMALQIAVVAWNLALIPEAKRAAAYEEFLALSSQEEDPNLEHDTKETIDELIARKQQLFPKNHRFIIDFQLEDAGSQFHLSVASTPSSPLSLDQK